MGLYVDIAQTLDSSVNIQSTITRALNAELPYHSVTATIRYDPSYPYPNIGPAPRNVTVGFVQNITDIDTWVQFGGRSMIRQDHGHNPPILDSDIPTTGSGSDPAWYSSGIMSNGNRAFTSFLYGPALRSPTTTRGAGTGIPLALPGGVSFASDNWAVGAIAMQDYPRCAYYTNFGGASSGEPLEHARRRLHFRIWICLLADGDSPSVASNYHILAASSDLVSGHRVRMTGGGRLSGTGGSYDASPVPDTRSLGFTIFRTAPGRSVGQPVVNGTRAPDYNDGLYAAGACPLTI